MKAEQREDKVPTDTLVCGVCGDRVGINDLRQHLMLHNPNAAGMEWSDVRNVYEEAE